MALATLSIDIVAQIAKFEADLGRAARVAERFGARLDGALKTAGQALALGAVATSAAAAAYAIDRLLKAAADFQDLSDMTGASAEDLASLAVAAGTAGVEMDSIAGAMTKLAKGLTGVDDESKAAGAALKALGLNVAEFKRLDPVAQYEAIGKALAGFKDGAAKAAVAQVLFGKAGVEQLKVFKALEDQGGRTKILTQQQIEAADAYADAQAEAMARLRAYAQVAASQAAPAMLELTRLAGALAAEFAGIGRAADDLARGTGAQTFAEGARDALVGLGDVIEQTVRGFQRLGHVGDALQKMRALPMFGGFSEAGNISTQLVDNLSKTAGPSFSERLARQRGNDAIAGQLGATADALKPPPKRELDFAGAQKTAAASKAAAEAKKIADAQRAADLADYQRALQAQAAAFDANQTILEARRAAGLVSESDYYAAKIGLVELNTQAQVRALEQERDLIAQEETGGAERIQQQTKLADLQAEIERLSIKAAAEIVKLGEDQSASAKKIAAGFEAARAAAEDYIATIARANGRDLSGMGQGAQQREIDARRNQRDDQFLQRTSDLYSQERAGQITKDQLTEFLAIERAAHTSALEEDARYWDEKLRLQGDWAIGASDALRDYLDATENVAEQSRDVISSAFKGMEDALTSFATTGKADFKSLVNSILADLARLTIRQSITGPLAKLLGGAVGSRFGGAGSAGSDAATMPGLFAKGGAFDSGGLKAYRNTIVSSPTLFKFARGGSFGLMGEAGPEAIMPLVRGPSGHLGVRAQGASGGVAIQQTIHIGAGVSRNEVMAAMEITRRQTIADITDARRRGYAQ